MISLRPTLLVAAVLAGAVLAWQWRSSPEASPAPPAAAPPATVASVPAPAFLPSMPAGSAPQVATTSRQTLPQAVDPVAVAAPGIGSEGYGPHIERAHDGKDAHKAWEALTWLRRCGANEVDRQSAEVLRGQGVASDFMTERMKELDEESRRCQTVTAQHRAMLADLAQLAIDGGVPGAASEYAGAVSPASLSPDQRAAVLAALLRDARSGSAAGLLGAATAGDGWGVSDADKLSFLYAYGELNGPRENAFARSLVDRGLVKLKHQPTPQDQVAAQIEGQQILDRLQANKQP